MLIRSTKESDNKDAKRQYDDKSPANNKRRSIKTAHTQTSRRRV